jgi:hypothetical protein
MFIKRDNAFHSHLERALAPVAECALMFALSVRNKVSLCINAVANTKHNRAKNRVSLKLMMMIVNVVANASNRELSKKQFFVAVSHSLLFHTQRLTHPVGTCGSVRLKKRYNCRKTIHGCFLPLWKCRITR